MGNQLISTTSPMISSQLCPTNQSGLDTPLAKGPKYGFEYLATNLLEFQKLNSLPVNVNLDKLDEGSGIAA